MVVDHTLQSSSLSNINPLWDSRVALQLETHFLSRTGSAPTRTGREQEAMAGTAPASGKGDGLLDDWTPPPAEAAAALDAAPSAAPSNGSPSKLKGSLPAESVALHFVQQSWARRFGAQFTALFKKNLLVSWRNLRATTLRALAPL